MRDFSHYKPIQLGSALDTIRVLTRHIDNLTTEFKFTESEDAALFVTKQIINNLGLEIAQELYPFIFQDKA